MATVAYQQDWQRLGKLRLLLAKINAGTAGNDNGSVTFTDHDIRQYFDLLPSAFRYPNEIPRSEFESIVYRSCIDLRKQGRITAENLLHEVSQRATENLSR